jgi:hypothetical protein
MVRTQEGAGREWSSLRLSLIEILIFVTRPNVVPVAGKSSF